MEPFVIEQEQKAPQHPVYQVKEIRDWNAFLTWFGSDKLEPNCSIGMMGQIMHFETPQERFWWVAGFTSCWVHAGAAPLPPYGTEAATVVHHGMLEGRVELTNGPAVVMIGVVQEIHTGKIERKKKHGARIFLVQRGLVVAEQWRGTQIETIWANDAGVIPNIKALEAAIIATLTMSGRRF